MFITVPTTEGALIEIGAQFMHWKLRVGGTTSEADKITTRFWPGILFDFAPNNLVVWKRMLEEGYRNFLGVKNVRLFVVFEASKDYVRLIKVEFSSGFGGLLSKSAISLLPATLSRKGFLLFLIKKPCKGIFSLESCHLNLKICVNSFFFFIKFV